MYPNRAELTIQEIDFDRKRMSLFFSNSSRMATAEPSRQRQRIDQLVQAYLDSRRELTDSEMDNVDDAVTFLKNDATIEQLRRGGALHDAIRRIHQVRLGSKAVQAASIRESKKPTPEPSIEIKPKLVEPKEIEKECDARRELEETIIGLFDAGHINSATAQTLLFMFELRGSDTPFDARIHQSMIFQLKTLYAQLGIAFKDYGAQRDKFGGAIQYDDPVINEGMSVLYGLTGIMQVSRGPAQWHPLEEYFSSRLNKIKIRSMTESVRAGILTAVDQTLYTAFSEEE